MPLKFDAAGLIPAIAQDRLTGEVRMLGYMNAEALAQTLQTGRATFYSRSRARLWVKGESSGNFLQVAGVFADCDEDTLLLEIEPSGPTCHTGQRNCFFAKLNADGSASADAELGQPFLAELEQTIAKRQVSSAEKSYTRALLDGGAPKIAGKIREEASELAAALESETDERVLSEAADVLFHLLVGLRARSLDFRGVVDKLAQRTHQSGHQEKANRKPG